MDRNIKLKVANMIVVFDDAIKSSKGIADLLGKVIASAIGGFFEAPIDVDKADASDVSEGV